MATAGSGDVLTGMLAGVLGQYQQKKDINQRERGFFAASLAVFLHGLCGDRASEAANEYYIVASDLIKQIPFIL